MATERFEPLQPHDSATDFCAFISPKCQASEPNVAVTSVIQPIILRFKLGNLGFAINYLTQSGFAGIDECLVLAITIETIRSTNGPRRYQFPQKLFHALLTANAANHRRQKAERRRSGAFCRPCEFALLCFKMSHLPCTKFPPIHQHQFLLPLVLLPLLER